MISLNTLILHHKIRLWVVILAILMNTPKNDVIGVSYSNREYSLRDITTKYVV